MAIALSLVSGHAWAFYCDPPGAAATAGVLTTANVTAAVNAFTATAITEQTTSLVLALQGHAAQVSSNLKAQVTGQGMITEAKSNQDTQRLVQSDQVAAAKAFQFSTTLCQAGTGAAIAVAQAAAAVPSRVLQSQANARRSSGYPRPENSVPPAQAAEKMFKDRKNNFCDPHDPACRGIATASRPDADHMPGTILAMPRLDNSVDYDQATNLIQNLTQPVPVPAMTERQISEGNGRDAYLRGQSYRTQLNLAKDVVTSILYDRRIPSADMTFYNGMAKEAGLPPATNGVSAVDMDNMRYRDKFNQNYTTRLASLNTAPLLREVAGLMGDKLQQGLRTNELLEQDVLLLSSMLSTLLEPKIAASAGNLR